jgi:sugar phosphate isomerase/epimerase
MWSLVSDARAGRLDVPDFVRYGAELAVPGVELLDVFWTDRERQLPQVERALGESGLVVSAYAIGNDLVQPAAAERARQVQSIRDGVDMARRLGAPLLRIFSGNAKPGVTPAQGHEWIVAGLREGAAFSAERDVTLALENHGLFAGRADQVRAIIDEVGSPALRANVDTGNFLLVNQGPVDAARELARLAAYVHLKDFRALRPGEEAAETYSALDGTRYVGTVIGDGEVDLQAVLAELRAAGYDGWLSIEYEGTGDAREGLSRSVAAAQALLGQGTGGA